MRILVTGAAGFVAPYLARELARRGHEVVATDVAQLRGTDAAASFPGGFALCDISSADAVRSLVRDTRADGCVHLAGISFIPDAAKDPGRLYAINIAGTLNLLDAFAAERPGAKFLFVSSAQVYGCTSRSDEAPVDEDTPVYPLSPYAISKTASEDAVRAYGHYKGLHTLVARPSNHTGPGQSAKFVAPSFIGQALEILRGARKAYVAGNLECERDFSDVRDIVCAYATILERGENGGTYNIRTGARTSIGGLLESIMALTGASAPVETDPALWRPTDYSRLLDTSRIRALGWTPERTLDVTLRDMFAGAGAAEPSR